jgi:4-amino-4-deoxy-L-arabinose transferase-like glycosyltransferase
MILGRSLAYAALVQHILGMAMAGALYALMVRRGVYRWLAALAVAPVLLDAYQLNAEQTIMPDVLFETLLVAGLVLLLWQPRPGLFLIILAGLALGASAPVRQVGEALIAPALIYVVFAAQGWRKRLLHGAVLTACFALPIVGYMSYSAVIMQYGFELSNMGNAYLYGRAAHAADCGTLKNIPAVERPLCPSSSLSAALGVDGLVNAPESPRVTYEPVNVQIGFVIDTNPWQKDLAYRVLRQQPMRVVGDIAHDSAKIFALTRNTQQGDTPISRWQFQFGYPYYPPGVTRHGYNSASKVFGRAGGGGHARVHWKADIALRYYQLHGGYTPGPVFLFGLLAGIAGMFTFRRRRDSGPALACLLITGSAVAVLLGADLYEFSWRYQLPALVTLPVAAAFGITALVRFFGARRQGKVAAGAGGAGGAAEAVSAVEAAEAVEMGEAAPEARAPVEAPDELAVAGSEQAAP